MPEATVNVYGLDGKPVGSIKLPKVFETPYRPDVISRAVVAAQTHRFLPKGRDPIAGKRTTAESYGVGRGMARISRVKGEQYSEAGAGAFVPSTVGGRRTHPPRAEKSIYKKINRKERLLALRSAIAATAVKNLVAGRGHRVEGVPSLPLVASDEIQSLARTVDVRNAFTSLGVWRDAERVLSAVKIRSGRGRMRGRGRKHGVGPLLVVAEDKGVGRAARNIPGVNVVRAKTLSIEALAPGTQSARLTVWSESALKLMNQIFGGI